MTKNSPCGKLFQEYLRICNEALAANKGCFPYDRITHQMEYVLQCHPVEVVIYGEDERQPEAMYDMTLQDGALAAKAAHKPHAKHPWLLSKTFLEQVARQPDDYIQNPALLDWKWLSDHRVGV